MQYLAYIIIGVVGIWLGRHFAAKYYTGGWGMRDLQQKATEAREEKFENIEKKILDFVKENGRITNNLPA